MNFKTPTRLALAAIAALALSTTAAFAEVKAKVGHAMPESHPQAAAMNKFAELASTYTKGNVKIQAYHSAVLGSDEKQLQAVQAGTQEFYIGTLAPLSARVKEVQVWDLPFMFQNEKEVYAVLDGASSKKIFTMIEPAGLVGLTWTGMGFAICPTASAASASWKT
jgi:TRAP-type transport system periplasmic protein